MAVSIQPQDGARLRVCGDVEGPIQLSHRALRDGFAIAISDGTLVLGRYDSGLDEYRFSVSIEGAAIVSIRRGELGDTIDIAWRIEWISVSAAANMLGAFDVFGTRNQHEFGFEATRKQVA